MIQIKIFRSLLYILTLVLSVGSIAMMLLVRMAKNTVHNLTHPERNLPPITPDKVDIKGWEDVSFPSNGLTLKGWFIPPQPEANGKTLLYIHGLGGNRSNLLFQASHLHKKHGYGALLFDLRNCGYSEGHLTTFGYRESDDICAAFNYLLTRQEVNPGQIGAIGHSLGGSALMRAASQNPQIRVIVIQSTFTSVKESIEENIRRLRWLPAYPLIQLVAHYIKRETGIDIDDIAPIDELNNVAPRPIMFVHGTVDDAISYANSERFYAAATEPKKLYLIQDAGHLEHLNENLDNSWNAIASFVTQHLS